jgi:arylsulfatase A-like enzyme
LEVGSNGELKGFKTSLWEGGIRVPAIAWYPEKIKAGTVSESVLISMDVLPTLLSIAGIKTENEFDGKIFQMYFLITMKCLNDLCLEIQKSMGSKKRRLEIS